MLSVSINPLFKAVDLLKCLPSTWWPWHLRCFQPDSVLPRSCQSLTPNLCCVCVHGFLQPLLLLYLPWLFQMRTRPRLSHPPTRSTLLLSMPYLSNYWTLTAMTQRYGSPMRRLSSGSAPSHRMKLRIFSIIGILVCPTLPQLRDSCPRYLGCLLGQDQFLKPRSGGFPYQDSLPRWERAEQILSIHNLSDKKPSALVNHLLTLLSSFGPEILFQQVFHHSLPTHIHDALAGCDACLRPWEFEQLSPWNHDSLTSPNSSGLQHHLSSPSGWHWTLRLTRSQLGLSTGLLPMSIFFSVASGQMLLLSGFYCLCLMLKLNAGIFNAQELV